MTRNELQKTVKVLWNTSRFSLFAHPRRRKLGNDSDCSHEKKRTSLPLVGLLIVCSAIVVWNVARLFFLLVITLPVPHIVGLVFLTPLVVVPFFFGTVMKCLNADSDLLSPLQQMVSS